MSEYKFLDHDFEYARYVVKAEPSYVFEYEQTAWRLADKVNGEVVELYSTSLWNLFDATEDDCSFIGYGVLSDTQLL